jgi:hypothetical protein
VYPLKNKIVKSNVANLLNINNKKHVFGVNNAMLLLKKIICISLFYSNWLRGIKIKHFKRAFQNFSLLSIRERNLVLIPLLKLPKRRLFIHTGLKFQSISWDLPKFVFNFGQFYPTRYLGVNKHKKKKKK